MWNSKESFNNNLKRDLKKLYRTFEKEPQCAIYVDRESKIGTYKYILVKFIYSEKATEFCEISTVDLTGTTLDKSTVRKVLLGFFLKLFSSVKGFSYGIVSIVHTLAFF